MSENLNENNTIIPDSFATNIDTSDGVSNVSAFKALADVNTSGGSLPHLSFIGVSDDSVRLKDYLSRPRLMYSGHFDTYNVTPELYRFAFDFISSDQIQEKLKYFKLIRGTFQVKLVVTSAPYAAGILAMSSVYDEISSYGAVLPGDVPFLIANLIQKTNVMLDLGSVNTATISIPFHLREPYINNSNPDNAELKRMILYLFTLTNLYNTQQDDNVRVYYKLYVSLQDAEITIPTMDVGTYTSELTSSMKGPISYPASIISNIGHSLSNIPIIGPFAMATSLVATGIGEAAKVFGFSRPRDLGTINYPHVENAASGFGEIKCKSLTLDPKQEVTIDTHQFGESNDNLTFKNIIGRYGYFQTFNWRTSDMQNTQVAQWYVNPMVVNSTSSGGTRFYNPTPLAYGSILYSAWRGSLVYKILIPANRFVRGKLRIFWKDNITTSGDLDVISNNTLSMVVDVTSSAEVEIVVPWLQENLYRTISGFNQVGRSNLDNGAVCIRVEEPLICNNPDYTQSIVVFVRAGDDFELAVPTNKFIQSVVYDQPNKTVTNYALSEVISISELFPPTPDSDIRGIDDFAIYTSDLENNANNPVLKIHHSFYPNGKNTNEPAMFHIGERINTFRVLLKRFHIYRRVRIDSNVYCFLPYQPAPIQTSKDVPNVVVPRSNNPIIHLSRMFGGMRGSMRYQLIPTYSRLDNTTTVVGRGFWNELLNIYVPGTYEVENSLLQTIVQAGIGLFRTNYEPLVFDIPYQAYHWFFPTRRTTTSLSHETYDQISKQYGALITCNGGSASFDAYVATGDDFSFVIYNGPPTVAQYTYPSV